MTTGYISNKLKVLALHYKKMGLINLSSYIVQRIFTRNGKMLKVSIAGYSYPILLRNTQSDTQIFTQIFLREELKVKLHEVPSIIIDGGANIGMGTLYLRRAYPHALIIAVEPDKSNFEMLLKNTMRFENVICYNSGLWDKNAKLKIVNKNAGNESFIVTELNPTDPEDEAIDAITIGEIVKRNNIDKIGLLKLDIEGSESRIFASNYKEWVSITDNLLVEIHNWIDPNAHKIVMSVLGHGFENRMVGEYHFFTRLMR